MHNQYIIAEFIRHMFKQTVTQKTNVCKPLTWDPCLFAKLKISTDDLSFPAETGLVHMSNWGPLCGTGCNTPA